MDGGWKLRDEVLEEHQNVTLRVDTRANGQSSNCSGFGVYLLMLS
jgi:hypothetical protein